VDIERGNVEKQFLLSSVLVSIFRNKGTKSDLRALFSLGPPVLVYGDPSSDFVVTGIARPFNASALT